MEDRIKLDVQMDAKALLRAKAAGNVAVHGHWEVVCRDADGKIKWSDSFDNLVTSEGLDELLDVALSAKAATTTWYAGLTDSTPTAAAGDTMASHAGWVEVQAYDEAVRQTWVEAGVSGQSITNSASPAVFTIDTNSTTIGGAFLTSVNTKGGSTGILYAVGAFTAGDKSLDDNDTLTVTATFTTAAA